MKYSLAINTTTAELGLCLSNFREDFRCQTWNLGQELSTLMHQYLAEFIQPQPWEDFQWLAVAKGPGGFTGTRIGVVTARTLAQQLEIPLFAISTLAAVAWSAVHPTLHPIPTSAAELPQLSVTEEKNMGREKSDRAIAVQMPAQRGELFVAIYAVHSQEIEALLSDTVMTPEAWQETLSQWHHLDQKISLPPGSGASVAAILQLADLEWQQGKRPHWSDALPFYGQHPVAL
jgi:tRNA threonylcarbamoyl adenosine modification protein YeaZ